MRYKLFKLWLTKNSDGRTLYKPQNQKEVDRTIQLIKEKRRKLATINYKRRKLDKDVKNYIKRNRVLRSRDIESIGRQHGFYIVSTLFREN